VTNPQELAMSLRKTLLTSIGAKSVMAGTGIALMLFLVGHMIGNLQIFLGADQLNSYAAKLQGLGSALWVIRLGLLAILLAHLGSAIRVWRQNQDARPVPYQFPGNVQTSFAGRTMMMSGGIILAFLIYHLLHFTATVTDPHLAQLRADHDVYGMVIAGFSNKLTSLSYVAAQVLLGLHLSHGAKSLFQTLGFSRPETCSCYDNFARAFALVITLGNLSIPIAVMAGMIH
jgi:succinate dehydrogenase / fumarate reductase cytochrome b subunit